MASAQHPDIQQPRPQTLNAADLGELIARASADGGTVLDLLDCLAERPNTFIPGDVMRTLLEQFELWDWVSSGVSDPHLLESVDGVWIQPRKGGTAFDVSLADSHVLRQPSPMGRIQIHLDQTITFVLDKSGDVALEPGHIRLRWLMMQTDLHLRIRRAPKPGEADQAVLHLYAGNLLDRTIPLPPLGAAPSISAPVGAPPPRPAVTPRRREPVPAPPEAAPAALGITIIHALPGRVRLQVRALYRNNQQKQTLERQLVVLASVRRVSANALTGRLVVEFDSALSAEEVAEWVGRVLQGAPLPAAGPQEATREPWHLMEDAEVEEYWESTAETGLRQPIVAARQREFGPNALPAPTPRAGLAIFLEQFQSLPVALLGASALLSVFTGGVADALVILSVVGTNAVIGYYTESRAEKTISALTHGIRAVATVVRGGTALEIPGEELVPGDVIILKRGAYVPADARMLESDRLTVDESALTGESVPVVKHPQPVAEADVPLGGRYNMVYRGTVVTGGSARALVVATGAATEVGQIQRMMTEAEQMQTPLQRQLHMLGEQMVMLSLAICGSVFVLGLLRGRTALQMLKTSVSLAVAAVPEGLPTVSTTTLALGLRRLEEQKVFVRQLGAVETLGALQAICLDKTGTITRNRMTLVAAFANTNLYRVEDGHFYHDGVEHPVHRSSELRELLRLTALCSEVELVEEAGEGQLRGTPTERALVQAAQETGIDVADVRRTHPLVRIRLRSEQRIFMDTLHKDADHGWLLAVKGSPTEVLDLCSQQLVHGELQPLTEAARNRIVTENERMAGRALRVLGVAYGHENTLPEQAQNLVWVGLVGIADPPRPGMAELVAELHEAGIHTTMITGDQSATAYAVAREIGLSRQGRMEILDSTRIEELEADVLRTLAQRVDVFARVSPAHKLQIVQALQHAGLVVAMTGDGVNDGPALRAANIGIAMGGDGSDVAQEVADIVVGDDNLATLIGAVEQGRTIYDDIKKAVHFILSSNTSEILVTLTATAAGLGEPLNPMQLLWINLVTDIFPELALSLEPPEEDIMQRPPRDPHAPMFSNRDLRRIGLEGGVITTTAMGAYLWGLGRYGTGPRASTMAFTSLTAAQLLHAISCRSEPHSIFDAQPFPKNPYIPLAVGGGLLLQVLATLTPGVRTLLGATRLGLLDWGVAATAAVTPLLTNEIIKVIEREENSTWHPNTSSPPKP